VAGVWAWAVLATAAQNHTRADFGFQLIRSSLIDASSDAGGAGRRTAPELSGATNGSAAPPFRASAAA
jgi:hypothetical protein